MSVDREEVRAALEFQRSNMYDQHIPLSNNVALCFTEVTTLNGSGYTVAWLRGGASNPPVILDWAPL